MPYRNSTAQSLSLGIRSYALSRSTKHALAFFAYSHYFSKVCCKAKNPKIWSNVLRPGRKPHLASVSLGQIFHSICFHGTWHRPYPGHWWEICPYNWCIFFCLRYCRQVLLHWFAIALVLAQSYMQVCISNVFPAGTQAQDVICPSFVTSLYFCSHLIIS